MSHGQQPTVAKPGMVANALALFQGKPGAEDSKRDPLSGLSVTDLSSSEQDALVEAKKRKHASGGNVGSGAASSQSDNGGGGINKLDLMSLLKEQQEGTAIATKQFLPEYTFRTKHVSFGDLWRRYSRTTWAV